MVIDVGHLISGLTLVVTIVITLSTLVIKSFVQSNTRDRLFEARLTAVEIRIGLIFRGIEERLAGSLKMPIHHRLDALIDKLRNGTITYDETRELKARVNDRLKDQTLTPWDRQNGEWTRIAIEAKLSWFTCEKEIQQLQERAQQTWWQIIKHLIDQIKLW